MSLEPGVLTLEALSEPLQKVLGPQAPPQLRMMAARGLAPMGPQDLAVAIFQLAHDTDEAIARAARKTAGSLPDKILSAALSARIDPRVLDFYARASMLKPKLVELIVLNAATDDDTFIYLAANCTERELELLAANEQRILRTPKIIEALYFNRSARMSTVDRLIELAVRHGIRCEGIPAFDEAAEAIAAQGPPVFNGTDFEIDGQFHAANRAASELEAKAEQRAGGDGAAIVQQVETLIDPEVAAAAGQVVEEDVVDRKQRIQDLPMSAKIRMATVGNAAARAILVRDPNKVVALAAVRSPALSDMEAVSIAQNRTLLPEVITVIARNRMFLRNYQVKLGLVFNPKCPLAITLKLLSYLHEADVKMLAKSKNIPQQVATVARRLVEMREQKR